MLIQSLPARRSLCLARLDTHIHRYLSGGRNLRTLLSAPEIAGLVLVIVAAVAGILGLVFSDPILSGPWR